MKKNRFIIALLAITLFFAGCARAPRQASSSFYAPSAISQSGVYHTVEKGQTLYRIAKQYGVDVSELMRVNHIYSPRQLSSGQRIWVPRPWVRTIAKPVEPINLDRMRSIVGPAHPESRWQTITLHHSATHNGNARLFDRDHRRRKMGGLFYHFVIGNGTKSGDGLVEVGWRWKKQVKANRPYDIQICLVGNFNEEHVTDAQFNSLVSLMTILRAQYSVPLSSIRKHEDIKGRNTECPGKNFPFQKLLSKLSSSQYFS